MRNADQSSEQKDSALDRTEEALHSTQQKVANTAAAKVEVAVRTMQHIALKLYKETTHALTLLRIDALPQVVFAFEDIEPLMLDVPQRAIHWKTVGKQSMQSLARVWHTQARRGVGVRDGNARQPNEARAKIAQRGPAWDQTRTSTYPSHE